MLCFVHEQAKYIHFYFLFIYGHLSCVRVDYLRT